MAAEWAKTVVSSSGEMDRFCFSFMSPGTAYLPLSVGINMRLLYRLSIYVGMRRTHLLCNTFSKTYLYSKIAYCVSGVYYYVLHVNTVHIYIYVHVVERCSTFYVLYCRLAIAETF